MTLETRFPKNDWRSGYFGPENLANTIERVEKLKKILAGRHDTRGNVVAFSPVSSRGEHDDHRHAHSGACA